MQNQKMIKFFNYRNSIISGLLLFTVFSAFIFNSVAIAKSVKLTVNQIEYKELIQKYFPNYVLMDIEELEPYAKDYFKEHYSNLDPSIVCKDFDGNNLLDFAFLIRTSKIKDGNTIFAIFLQSKNRQFKLEFCLNMESYLDFVYILPIEAGKILTETEAIEGPGKEVKLKNAAVHLIYFGKSSVAYYWDDRTKKFESIWTSD